MKACICFSLLFVSLMSGCGYVDKISLDSEPPNAFVYMIPKHDIDLKRAVAAAVDAKDFDKLQDYRVGYTPLKTRQKEKVFLVLFVLGNQVEQQWLDILVPPKSNQLKVKFP